MERKLKQRPRLLLGYVDSVHAVQTARNLRRQGWEVHLVASGAEVIRLVDEFQPWVVVIDTELPDQSGWLTCAKVTFRENPPKVILLAPNPEQVSSERLAQVGATSIMGRFEGIESLVSEVLGEKLAQAV